ncbi:MAG: signal peptidase I [Candidatus Hydrogenedentota bacterium]
MEEETPSPQEAIEAEREEEAQNLKREIFDFAKLVVWFLIIFLGLKYFVVEGYEVQGESMEPNLSTNDRILVFKLPHHLSNIGLFSSHTAFDEGDIIVFKSPDTQDKRYVKRIIGMRPKTESGTVDANTRATDTVWVEFDEGKVYVNNHIVDEAYLSDRNRESHDHHELELGPGEYYVLGDNRSVSKDSRSFDAIEDEAIIGRAVIRFWPPSKFSLIR